MIMAAARSIGGSSPYPNSQEVSLEGPIFTITVRQNPIIIKIIPNAFFIILSFTIEKINLRKCCNDPERIQPLFPVHQDHC